MGTEEEEGEVGAKIAATLIAAIAVVETRVASAMEEEEVAAGDLDLVLDPVAVADPATAAVTAAVLAAAADLEDAVISRLFPYLQSYHQIRRYMTCIPHIVGWIC